MCVHTKLHAAKIDVPAVSGVVKFIAIRWRTKLNPESIIKLMSGHGQFCSNFFDQTKRSVKSVYANQCLSLSEAAAGCLYPRRVECVQRSCTERKLTVPR